MNLSEAGVILGTAAYMSPEQARGLNVDKRADIWAFGVILQEMLSGKRLFTGASVADILIAVNTQCPDLSTMPVEVRPLLTRCLERDPRKRLRDIGDIELLLAPVPSAPSAEKRSWTRFGSVGTRGRARDSRSCAWSTILSRCSCRRTAARPVRDPDKTRFSSWPSLCLTERKMARLLRCCSGWASRLASSRSSINRDKNRAG
jgi:serine/threonine protein kinase